ncbi:GNAT family N-acetyltransferase [Microbacterium sp. P02]|uniref:GNAT family N-acetyltransferase n=1 Tax=Microbacterium sp. P02 TaxID=3366260 RepID=UPI00366A5E7A
MRLHEWREVRDLRIEAVSDPQASLAFLTTPDEELARSEAFWRERTAGAAMGDTSAQFVALVDGDWAGSVTVLLREPGTRDHLGHDVLDRRADVVGVYLSPAHRGRGLLGELMDAAAAWASASDVAALTLDVHTGNTRAQAAYRRIGFEPTGVTFTSTIGPELEMRKPL